AAEGGGPEAPRPGCFALPPPSVGEGGVGEISVLRTRYSVLSPPHRHHRFRTRPCHAERYQGTLITTTRRKPLKSRYALMMAAVWLCSRKWYQRVETSSGTSTATSRPGWARCRSVTTWISGA